MKNKILIFWLVTLRVIIGWHFLFEGMAKFYHPNWSSAGYLLDSQGIFKSIFYWMASSPGLLNIIDFLNVWGLILIGLGLILGLFTKISLWSGVALLAMYFLSHPPFIGVEYGMPSEGSYMFVNKTLIEMIAMIVLVYFPTGRYIGIDRFICKKDY
ncbi:MAG: DoxX family membrane protein [Bacteroidales bacterium]|nr:DoxX family membrane protein [Bacteroidales bacterium]